MAAVRYQDIVRFVALDEALATSGQPNEAQLAALAADGYKLVINLGLHNDPRYSLKDEAGTVQNLGMHYVHIPVNFASPQLTELHAFFAAMDGAGESKTLVHCAQNKRVPVFIALYRILRLGWGQRMAIDAMHQVWEPDEVWQHFIYAALAAESPKLL